jgi:hypothetical protein
MASENVRRRGRGGPGRRGDMDASRIADAIAAA